MKYIFIFLIIVSATAAQNQYSVCMQAANPPFIDQGFMPYGGVSGDFNGDGNIDLITHTTLMPGFSRFFGNGNGTFTVSSLYPVNGGQDGVLLSADFNSDGNKDLMFLQRKSTSLFPQATDSMLIYLNPGTGTFVRSFAYSLPASPSGAVVGKFNNDNTFDVAVNFFPQTYFAVYHGIGNGSFGLSVQYTTSTFASNMLYSDINNDGRKDIVRSVQVFKGLTNGTFSGTPIALNLSVGPTNTINLNNDNLPDLISVNSNTVYLSINAGNYSFNQIQAITLPDFVRSIAKIDLDSDGIGDFAVGYDQRVSFYAKTVTNYQAVSTHTFLNFALAWPWGLIIDDLNNDQREDAVVLCDNTRGPFIYLNCNNKDVGISSESFEEPYLFPNPTAGQLRVYLPHNYQRESCKIAISNLVGETFLPKFISLNEETLQVDLGEYSSGIYFLQILNCDAKFEFRKKILLQK